MRYTNEFDNNKDSIDIYSSYQDISSSSKHTSRTKKRKKRKSKSKTIKALLIVFICALVALGALFGYAFSILSSVDTEPLETKNPEELNISTSEYDGVKNIALFGIDSRSDDTSGRSDAVLVLSIDKKHDKIKLISIARDSYVSIDGHGKDKLTHAYAYGKSTLAVKTLNKNFGLEITDYVTVNFYEFSRIIDYIGGVKVDVDQKEMAHLNNYVIPELKSGTGLECDKITGTGTQLLTGTQALCYARIRKIDGDIERGNRQKEVLSAMFAKVKDMGATKLPKVAQMVLSECQTSLSTNDIMGLGLWAVSANPQMENISIPNENISAKGKTMGGVWYSVYELEKAKSEMKKFILETE